VPFIYDATLKDLARDFPADYLARLDRPPAKPVTVLNVDLSVVSSATDVVLGIGQPPEEVVHIDFQASASATKHLDILIYNALLHRQYKVPVHGIVVLLRPEAAHSNMTGQIHYAPRPQHGKMEFNYEVIRLWDIPAEEFVQGDLGTVPLAPLGKLPANLTKEEGLAVVVPRAMERLQKDASEERLKALMVSALLLTGLIVKPDVALQLFKGFSAMRESSTFMAILEEGRVMHARKILRKLGEKFLGPANEATVNRLESIGDVEQLDTLTERVVDVSSWEELFQ
jgi:hypothetical protein